MLKESVLFEVRVHRFESLSWVSYQILYDWTLNSQPFGRRWWRGRSHRIWSTPKGLLCWSSVLPSPYSLSLRPPPFRSLSQRCGLFWDYPLWWRRSASQKSSKAEVERRYNCQRPKSAGRGFRRNKCTPRSSISQSLPKRELSICGSTMGWGSLGRRFPQRSCPWSITVPLWNSYRRRTSKKGSNDDPSAKTYPSIARFCKEC